MDPIYNPPSPSWLYSIDDIEVPLETPESYDSAEPFSNFSWFSEVEATDSPASTSSSFSTDSPASTSSSFSTDSPSYDSWSSSDSPSSTASSGSSGYRRMHRAVQDLPERQIALQGRPYPLFGEKPTQRNFMIKRCEALAAICERLLPRSKPVWVSEEDFTQLQEKARTNTLVSLYVVDKHTALLTINRLYDEIIHDRMCGPSKKTARTKAPEQATRHRFWSDYSDCPIKMTTKEVTGYSGKSIDGASVRTINTTPAFSQHYQEILGSFGRKSGVAVLRDLAKFFSNAALANKKGEVLNPSE